MAIYHCSTKMISRGTGRSAVAAAAYRAGEKLINNRTGLTHDFTRKNGVVHSEIISNFNIEIDRNQLWNLAEQCENRKDSRTAREWVIALPDELNADQRKQLAKDFAISLANRYGVIADLAIHEPSKGGNDKNHHAHIMLTTRKAELDPENNLILTAKTNIELSNKKRKSLGLGTSQNEIKEIRKAWAELANSALAAAEQEQRIDHLSYKDRGLNYESTQHEGPAVTKLRKLNIDTDVSLKNDAIKQRNAERLELEQIINRLNQEIIIEEHSLNKLKDQLEHQSNLIDQLELLKEQYFDFMRFHNHRLSKQNENLNSVEDRFKQSQKWLRKNKTSEHEMNEYRKDTGFKLFDLPDFYLSENKYNEMRKTEITKFENDIAVTANNTNIPELVFELRNIIKKLEENGEHIKAYEVEQPTIFKKLKNLMGFKEPERSILSDLDNYDEYVSPIIKDHYNAQAEKHKEYVAKRDAEEKQKREKQKRKDELERQKIENDLKLKLELEQYENRPRPQPTYQVAEPEKKPKPKDDSLDFGM
jgi:hypothetical protein